MGGAAPSATGAAGWSLCMLPGVIEFKLKSREAFDFVLIRGWKHGHCVVNCNVHHGVVGKLCNVQLVQG